ncbi:hypothetical protein [Lyngbya aestuarii]|uniref:hypothetical protein n=1 Tax=Lyngbya aestuarii TaxID=118322 RepID=UPI00403DD2A3
MVDHYARLSERTISLRQALVVHSVYTQLSNLRLQIFRASDIFPAWDLRSLRKTIRECLKSTPMFG